MSSAEEQLCRLRRRVALAQFYDDYTRAQADPHSFLYPEQKKISVKSLTATRKRKRANIFSTSLRRWRITLLNACDESVAKLLDLPYKTFCAFYLRGREEP